MKQGEVVKAEFMEFFREVVEQRGDEVLLVKSGTLSIPWAVEGEEGYVNVTFSTPKGARDGCGYNGHEEAQNFQVEQKAKAEAKVQKASEKAKKMARDEARRKKKAEEKKEG